MVAPTILLIDDNAEILTLLNIALQRRGYRVVTALDGNVGLATAERETPNLIIVDMVMPQQSGLRVLEKLKARPGGPPIIMITANEEPRHRLQASLLGADAYFRKPFAMDELLVTVERLCPAGLTKDEQTRDDHAL